MADHAGPGPLRRRLGTVRARATLGAVLGVGSILLIFSVASEVVLRRSLTDSVVVAAKLRADEVTALLGRGNLADLLVQPSRDEDLSLVEVSDSTGRVIAESKDLTDEAPIDLSVPAGRNRAVAILRHPPFESDEDFVVLARRVASPEGPVVVKVAASLKSVDATMGTIRRILVFGDPLALLAVGLTSWLVIRRAFRPIETIRAEVAEISGSALDRRVPEPVIIDEIGRLARTMNLMLGRLQGASDRQRRFLADASHELKSPLASLRAQLEVANLDARDSEHTAVYDALLAEQERVERLVGDLLLMARIDEGMVSGHRVPVNLDDVVLAEVSRLRTRGRVDVDISAVSAGQVMGDAEHLARVVRNLLENAETHARSEIRVDLATLDRAVELRVCDDGEGIPEADRERVFERFARVDQARSRAEGGTGLGLAIARDLVEAHHGTIQVVDSESGACLLVSLPAIGDSPTSSTRV